MEISLTYHHLDSSFLSQDKPKDAHWDVSQNNIVKYLLETWKLKDRGFTEKDVNHVIGALEVNAFEITQPASGKSIKRFYFHIILSILIYFCPNF